jgi:hypothetical protein
LGFDFKFSYNKITNLNAGRKLNDHFSNLLQLIVSDASAQDIRK